jgi:hypothetical protein
MRDEREAHAGHDNARAQRVREQVWSAPRRALPRVEAAFHVPVLSKQPTERLHGRTVRQVSLQEKIEMKKLTMAAMAVLFCASFAVRAENTRRSSAVTSSTNEKFFVGVDGDFALPLSTYGDANGVGGGLMLTGEYPLMPELSATARVGFQYHMDKNLGPGADVHFHSVPVLLGAKYYLMSTHGDRQGLFGALELGVFDVIAGSNVPGASASEIKVGTGVGIGYAMKQWNARVNLHSHDVGHFGDMLMVTAGIGYQFAGF